MFNNIRHFAITENSSVLQKDIDRQEKNWIVKPNNLDVYELELHCYLECPIYCVSWCFIQFDWAPDIDIHLYIQKKLS